MAQIQFLLIKARQRRLVVIADKLLIKKSTAKIEQSDTLPLRMIWAKNRWMNAATADAKGIDSPTQANRESRDLLY
ncbi:hypothetical protein KZX46_03590 (plasmid) [Polymorphobacter sp. PAMC 29334]|uniref:hypothetical protein n=1 Tax=Polymorphobacter sp. PAMC 29334 TaxID=2862331 RepID=UPI001C76C778|nr:hypothetical protein [Polymorphobacter sp. PAMC 29334]QYE33203.1 hypothetical protein KZX46_03590 [Polymorphobacter sp. PAMC 29334]